ncbi:phosphate acetyltransferase [Candidatus Peregrinibacteria bacterium]|nr:phosphate acetyltransferase [Candidatus Peregrinibacteria bacterium]
MHKFIKKVYKLAKKLNKRIVFTDGAEERILQAAKIIQGKKIAKIILIGHPQTIKKNAAKFKVKLNWEKIEIQNPKTARKRQKYLEELLNLRKDKGLKKSEAQKLMLDPIYFGTMMLQMNDADGMLTGLICPTHDSLRPVLQIIKTKELFHKVSGVFFMILEKRLLLFADTVVTVEPNSHDLADIAIDTAETAKKFGIEPKIALLSFSTKGSNDHPSIDKIREAVKIIKFKKPNLKVDGEMQVDSALVKEVATIKCPNSNIQGDANILIFPSLEAGNIAYKLVERLGRAKAVGPLLQGLKKAVNDLSRGASVDDIVNVTAFTACES